MSVDSLRNEVLKRLDTALTYLKNDDRYRTLQEIKHVANMLNDVTKEIADEVGNVLSNVTTHVQIPISIDGLIFMNIFASDKDPHVHIALNTFRILPDFTVCPTVYDIWRYGVAKKIDYYIDYGVIRNLCMFEYVCRDYERIIDNLKSLAGWASEVSAMAKNIAGEVFSKVRRIMSPLVLSAF